MMRLWLGIALVWFAGSAAAHPLAPALLELEERAEGEVAVRWKTSRLRPQGADVRPVLPDTCKPLDVSTRTLDGSAVTERWNILCDPAGLVGREIAIEGLDRSKTNALVRVVLADGRIVSGLLNARESRFRVSERASPSRVFSGYLRLGVEHLLFGFDHVLFVFGLFLLVPGGRRLLFTITAFTVGHSLTLSLATLGWVKLPSTPVEVGIAASIVLLGAELARGESEPITPLRRHPWSMALGFGLLHGLGFAAALREIGLPEGEIPLALFSFNVGVEIGQLLFVLPLLLLAYIPVWRMVPMRIPAYVIGSLAVCWCLERGSLLF
jgi:hydrogenase/urease accessory protein HupE